MIVIILKVAILVQVIAELVLMAAIMEVEVVELRLVLMDKY
jgi:hypothetical protein